MDACARNLKRGITEGIYRENINAEIITRLYVEKIDLVFDATVFPPTEFNFKDIHMEMVRYHIRGIANERGIAYLTERISKEQINL